MSLTLHFHPLASYCWKALIALYENDTPFEKVEVDLGDPVQRARLEALWPLAKFPVLEDHARKQVVPESTLVVEYLAQHYPGRVPLVPADPLQARLWDRFCDQYVHERMQKIVLDRLRPAGERDGYGVEQAKRDLESAYAILDAELAHKRWLAGESFSLADCAAFPALYYGRMQVPFAAEHTRLAAYLERLHARASIARVLQEAEPYLHLVPR
jgi:glutathione S-transferase